jgi:hypothetical protein
VKTRTPTMMEMHATRQKTTMMKPLLSLMAWKNIVELVMTMLMSVMIRMAIIMVAILEMEMQRSFN